MSTCTTLTILSENTSGPRRGVLGEHGWAVLVQRGAFRFLFDTGAGYVLLNNAGRLGQDLGRLDGVALSHGHNDHTGGLTDLLLLHDGGIPVDAHPEVGDPKYSVEEADDGREARHYIALPWPVAALEAAGARWQWLHEPTEIAEGVWLSGEIPRHTPFEHPVKRLRLWDREGWRQDEMVDELALYLRGSRGLIVLLGCAHRGLINTIEHARRVTGIADVQAVVGGTHLVGQSREDMETAVAALQSLRPELVGTAHCTGVRANALIATRFGEAFRQCAAGTVLELD